MKRCLVRHGPSPNGMLLLHDFGSMGCHLHVFPQQEKFLYRTESEVSMCPPWSRTGYKPSQPMLLIQMMLHGGSVQRLPHLLDDAVCGAMRIVF